MLIKIKKVLNEEEAYGEAGDQIISITYSCRSMLFGRRCSKCKRIGIGPESKIEMYETSDPVMLMTVSNSYLYVDSEVI